MLWIFIALLVLAEPIPALESNLQPNQQVQHFTSLINGAILAEGVITNKIKIDDMTTDWMIVDSMPRDRDWISSLDSNPQLAEIQELLGQLGPFLDVVKNGYKKEVPMDQLEKVAKLTQAIQSVPALKTSPQEVLESFKNHFKTFTIDFGIYNQSLDFIEFLPRAIPYLREASSNKLLAETIQTGLDFINAVKNIDVNKLNQSLAACSKQDAQNLEMDKFFDCEVKLYREVQKVSSIPKRSDSEKAAYFIRAYHYAKNADNFDKFLKQKAEIVEIRTHLQGLLTVVDAFSNTPDQKFVEDIFKVVNELKADGAKMESVRDALDEFKVISEAISKIANHQSSDNKQEAKSSNRFNSYRGFPNGTESLKGLIAALGSEGKLPSQYRNAKLPERINSMKVWMEKLSHLLDNAQGLIGCYEISANSESVVTFVRKADPKQSNTENVNLFDTIGSLSNGEVSAAINTLIQIENQIEFFEKSTWAMGLYKEMFGGQLISENWNEPFWAMPSVFDFFIQAMEDFKEVREGKIDLDDVRKADRAKLHSTIMSHINQYIERLPSLSQFSVVAHKNDQNQVDKANIEDVKDKLRTLNDVKDSDLPPSESLPMDKLRSGLDAYAKVRSVTTNAANRKTAPLEKFLNDLKDVEAMKKSILPLSVLFNLTTTKTLLEALAASSIGEIPGISGEANDILVNLMTGSPFGSEVLQDLATGVSAFNKLVGGIDVSKLAKELSLVKADGEANGAIGKLVDGAKYVQIPADPSNVYSLFADDVKLPEHIKKLSDWISRVLEADHQTEKEYLEQNKEKFGALHALIHRVEKPMDADFKLLSDRIEFIFRVLQDDGKLGSGSIIIIVIVVLLLIGLSAGGGFFGYKRWAKIKARKQRDSEEGKKPKKPVKLEQMGMAMKAGQTRDFMSSRVFFDDGQVRLSSAIKKYEIFISQVTDEYNSLPTIDAAALSKEDRALMFNLKEERAPGAHWKHNLVKLPSGKYIPASKISGFKDRKFIAAQGPLKSGIEKFFEMLFVEDVGLIVQLCSIAEMHETDLREPGRQSMPYDDVVIAGIYRVEKVMEVCFCPLFKQNSLTIFDTKTGKSIKLTQIIMEDWPDTSVPKDYDSVVNLANLVRLETPTGKDRSPPRSIVVHCKAGIGRTMTFITICRCIDKIYNNDVPFYFLDVATQMRKERNMGIQNVLQYVYVIGVVARHAEMSRKEMKSPNSFFWRCYKLAFDCLYNAKQVMMVEMNEKHEEKVKQLKEMNEKSEEKQSGGDSVTDGSVEVSAKGPEDDFAIPPCPQFPNGF